MSVEAKTLAGRSLELPVRSGKSKAFKVHSRNPSGSLNQTGSNLKIQRSTLSHPNRAPQGGKRNSISRQSRSKLTSDSQTTKFASNGFHSRSPEGSGSRDAEDFKEMNFSRSEKVDRKAQSYDRRKALNRALQLPGAERGSLFQSDLGDAARRLEERRRNQGSRGAKRFNLNKTHLGDQSLIQGSSSKEEALFQERFNRSAYLEDPRRRIATPERLDASIPLRQVKPYTMKNLPNPTRKTILSPAQDVTTTTHTNNNNHYRNKLTIKKLEDDLITAKTIVANNYMRSLTPSGRHNHRLAADSAIDGYEHRSGGGGSGGNSIELQGNGSGFRIRYGEKEIGGRKVSRASGGQVVARMRTFEKESQLKGNQGVRNAQRVAMGRPLKVCDEYGLDDESPVGGDSAGQKDQDVQRRMEEAARVDQTFAQNIDQFVQFSTVFQERLVKKNEQFRLVQHTSLEHIQNTTGSENNNVTRGSHAASDNCCEGQRHKQADQFPLLNANDYQQLPEGGDDQCDSSSQDDDDSQSDTCYKVEFTQMKNFDHVELYAADSEDEMKSRVELKQCTVNSEVSLVDDDMQFARLSGSTDTDTRDTSNLSVIRVSSNYTKEREGEHSDGGLRISYSDFHNPQQKNGEHKNPALDRSLNFDDPNFQKRSFHQMGDSSSSYYRSDRVSVEDDTRVYKTTKLKAGGIRIRSGKSTPNGTGSRSPSNGNRSMLIGATEAYSVKSSGSSSGKFQENGRTKKQEVIIRPVKAKGSPTRISKVDKMQRGYHDDGVGSVLGRSRLNDLKQSSKI
eukprot:CAMPEP_0115016380 /NCGR_PEP_ID=MMETSP0216-20121206/27398_1 /TAXON_ID=223996 /ORGANISM="Protocruzia adherens, Strain Boccale" /LENGTH=789 /DNA_ID=CAMNT_0002386817 /DNA_START=90 /DNA_END=2459 /DNA_ORIENTATION=-